MLEHHPRCGIVSFRSLGVPAFALLTKNAFWALMAPHIMGSGESLVGSQSCVTGVACVAFTCKCLKILIIFMLHDDWLVSVLGVTTFIGVTSGIAGHSLTLIHHSEKFRRR
jgi:hypothetical protein